MSALAPSLLVYGAQVLLVVAAATVAAAVARLSLPSARLHYWRAVVALCLLLPALPAFPERGSNVTVTFGTGGRLAEAVAGGSALAPSILAILAWGVLAGIAGRALWLAAGALRLRRLRRRSRPAVLGAHLMALRDGVSARSDLRWTDDVAQPVTFGWRRPVILLPPRFASLGRDAQEAVLCHELLHVRRGDWLAIVAEEMLRAAFCCHPAMWWALEQVHLSREQVVDQQVMARTSSRRAYMDALVQFAEAGTALQPVTAFLRRRHLAARLRLLAKEPRMTRLRLACVVMALLVVMAAATGVVVRALPLDLPALGAQTPGATAIEVRLAELAPAPGLIEAVVQGSGQQIYLQPDPIVSSDDVTSARLMDAGGGHYSIAVAFGSAGSTRLAEATADHLGRPVAIVLNGKVIAAPVVRAPIRDSAVITDDYTLDQAKAIANGLGAGPRAAAPAQERFDSTDPGVVMPVVQYKARPQYTQAAKDAKIQGTVELSAVVRSDGTVGEVAVVSSLDPTYGLDDAAVEAVQQWTFTPGTKDGRAVDVRLHITVRFTLT